MHEDPLRPNIPFHRLLPGALGAGLFLAGCQGKSPVAVAGTALATSSIEPSTPLGNTVPSLLTGVIENGVGAPGVNIAPNAEIALMDPTSFRVLALGASDANGNFTLDPAALGPSASGSYYLLAAIQLGSALTPTYGPDTNGNDQYSYRTAVEWTGTGWNSIATSSAGVLLSATTTAVAAIGRWDPTVGLAGTMGKVVDDVPQALSATRNLAYVQQMVSAVPMFIQDHEDPGMRLADLGTMKQLSGAGVVSGSWINYQDGDATAARYEGFGVGAVDAQGNLYLCDNGNGYIREVHPDGSSITLAGDGKNGPAIDGAAAVAQFNQPQGIAVYNGVVYIADYNNFRIRMLAGGNVTTLAGGTYGQKDGLGTQAQFANPEGMCVDAQGNLYVADSNNACIRKVTPQGLVTTFAGSPNHVSGDQPGPAENGALMGWNPADVVTDGNGNFYISDPSDHVIWKVDSNGNMTSFAGGAGNDGGNVDGPAADARLDPVRLWMDPWGRLYFRSDSYLRVIENGYVRTVAGFGPGQWAPIYPQGDNSAWITYGIMPSILVRVDGSGWIRGDSQGNVYMDDPWERRVVEYTPGYTP